MFRKWTVYSAGDFVEILSRSPVNYPKLWISKRNPNSIRFRFGDGRHRSQMRRHYSSTNQIEISFAACRRLMFRRLTVRVACLSISLWRQKKNGLKYINGRGEWGNLSKTFHKKQKIIRSLNFSIIRIHRNQKDVSFQFKNFKVEKHVGRKSFLQIICENLVILKYF